MMRKILTIAGVALLGGMLVTTALVLGSTFQTPSRAAGLQFDASAARTPTSIGAIQLHLVDRDGTTANMTGTVVIDILDASGNPMEDRTYDCRDKCSAAIKTSLVSLLNAIRAQAVSEVIP